MLTCRTTRHCRGRAGARVGLATRGKSSLRMNSSNDSTRFSAHSARSSTCFRRASIRSKGSSSVSKQVQNCIANLRVDHKTSRASDLPTTPSLSPQPFASKGSRSALIRRVGLGHNLPSSLLSCPLLNPVSMRSQLLCSAYRRTRAPVLSSHIEGV